MRFANMNELLAIARERNLWVVEDCAHAHGGQFQGRGAGAGGDAGCFSFQESKLMTAGEGGFVLTNRLDCYEALQSVINCGRPSITDQFERKVLGANYRMTELQAALLLGSSTCGRNSRPNALATREFSPRLYPLCRTSGHCRRNQT